MSNGDPPPFCDEACQQAAKVILNGGIAARVLDETCHTIYEHLEGGHSFSNSEALVIQANKIEDEVFKFTKMVLQGIGFSGPWPNSMK